jgi:NADPH:quinone reductase-like Zn-dependent oxidoreductase
MSAIMHAIRQQAFGGPEVLELAEVQRPVPLPTEVLVRVRAVGVNPVETVIRSGQFPLLGEPPFILGWDISGVVEDIEPGVTRFQPGDEVYAARTEAAGRRFAGLSVEPDHPALEALAALADSGQLRVHLQATLGLAEAVKAHELLESGSVTGEDRAHGLNPASI